jgi:hypothetical protein
MRRLRVVVAVVAVAVLGVSGHVSAEDSRWTLYREDAFADFQVPLPDCAATGHTKIQVSFHQDFFRDHDGPVVRSVVFGVAIQDIDCGAQLGLVAEGNETIARAFDVTGRLKSAKVHTTIQACVTFPAAGACFPVDVDLEFFGVGKADVNKDRKHVHEPDCKISVTDVTAVRGAHVSGTISFTSPGDDPRSYSLTSADLSPAGATLSAEFQHNVIKGDGFDCTDH